MKRTSAVDVSIQAVSAPTILFPLFFARIFYARLGALMLDYALALKKSGEKTGDIFSCWVKNVHK
ncbi:MAG TPA: hypothetical protein VLA51_06120 [Paracoccaceae bacterium]|nr:hypothetical protein [Paracoccaceae bacterium]